MPPNEIWKYQFLKKRIFVASVVSNLGKLLKYHRNCTFTLQSGLMLLAMLLLLHLQQAPNDIEKSDRAHNKLPIYTELHRTMKREARAYRYGYEK